MTETLKYKNKYEYKKYKNIKIIIKNIKTNSSYKQK